MCGRFSLTAPAKEARERMRAHRAKAHPDRPLVARAPKPKPKPKIDEKAIEQARQIMRASRPKMTRPRGSGQPRGRRTYLPDAVARDLHERYMEEGAEIVGTIALVEGIWRELGFANAASCAGALRHRWHRLGLHVGRRGGTRGSRPDVTARQCKLSQPQMRTVLALWRANVRPSQIARLCWLEWGYASPNSLLQSLLREAKRLPEEERPPIGRSRERRWVSAIAEERAREMLLAAPRKAPQ